MKSPLLFCLALCLVGWIACDHTPPPVNPSPSLENPGFFILNEGNFQRGNASLSFFDRSTDTLFDGVYEGVNQENLGDVLQSMSFFEGRAYLVVNNSQKIEVVDPLTLESLGRIDGMTSPRYFLGINPQKAYVSDLFAGALSVIDLENQSVMGKIELPGWTERMALVGNTALICNYDQPYLYLVDVQEDEITDSIAIGPRGEGIVVDKRGKVWVSTGAGISNNDPGALYEIDPQTWRVVQELRFPMGAAPSELQINAQGDSLFWLNQGVFAMNVQATALPTEPLIPEDGLFYGLGVDPASGDVLVADAIDFVQRGVILRHSSAGEFLQEFRAGIIPGAFAFRP